MVYRPDQLLVWIYALQERQAVTWEFSRDWLKARGVFVETPSRESTEWLISAVDTLV